MTAETHASSNGSGCNNASSSPVVDPDTSALTPDTVKLVSSDCNSNGMIIHGNPGSEGGGSASGAEIPRDDTDDNSYVFVTSNDDDSPIPVPLDDDNSKDNDNKKDPNGSPRESAVDVLNGKLAISMDHDLLNKAYGMDALNQDSLNKVDDNDDLPGATQVIHQNVIIGEIDVEPCLASGQEPDLVASFDTEVAASDLEPAVHRVDSHELDLVASVDAAKSTHVNHEPQEGILVSISSTSSEVDVSESTSTNQQNDDTDDLPAATQEIHQKDTVREIDSKPCPASGQDHQDSEVAVSVLESAVNGVDSPEPDLAVSLDDTKFTHVNYEPKEGILVSISSKLPEADVSESTSTNQQNDDTNDLPATTQVIHQNGTVEESAHYQLAQHEIDPKPSPAHGQDNRESEVTASVLEADVDLVDCHEPDLIVSLDVTKSSDACHEPQEDNLVSISSKLSEADVNQATYTNQQNDDTDGLPATAQVILQNGTVEESALHRLVHHDIDSKISASPGQDNQESEVTASVLKSEVDLVDSPDPDSAVALYVTKSFDVYHEPQEDNLVSVSFKSSEADVSQSVSPNQQNPKSFDEFVGPQESENTYSDATRSDSQQAEVRHDTDPATLVEGRPAVLEQLESSQFDDCEQRLKEEAKTELLSEAQENQQTVAGIGENGLSNLDQGSEVEQSVYEIDLILATATATDSVLNHNKDHSPVPPSSDYVQDTKEFNEYPDESEKFLELDESSTYNNILSPAPICLKKETDTVDKSTEGVQNFLEFTGEDKFQHGTSPLTNANVDGSCDLDIRREHQTELEASIPAESLVVNEDEVIEPEAYLVSAVSGNPEGAISFPVSHERSEIMLSKDVNGNDLGKSINRWSTDSTTTRTEFELGIADSRENVLSYKVDDAHDITKVGILDVDGTNTHSVLSHTEVKPEVEDMNSSGMDSEDIICNSALASKFEVSESSIVTDENVPNYIPEMKDVEDKGDQLPVLDVQSDDKLIGQESENMENIHRNEASMSLLESSTADALAGKDVAVGVVTRQFQFLIRIPRIDNLKAREQIKHAQLQVDEKTKIRDAFRLEIQKLKANCHGHAAEYEAAVSKARSSKRSVKSKRAEIDSLQVVINKVKNAISVDDIDVRIYSMEHMIQHETLPLKEEKQFIREIKQLKQLREQLSSNIGSQDEVQQALNKREEIEERLKILKKELDHLKDGVLKADAVARAAQKKYEDENSKLKELISQFEEANDIRQSAYHYLLSLRKELFEKNNLFRIYKGTAAAASDLAASRGREALHHLCHNQVETIMGLWNKDNEFRKEYVKCNVRSTVRRLGTLDGRSLGPDEEPPVLASFGVERPERSISKQANASFVVQTPILKQVNQTEAVEDVFTDDSNELKEGEAKNQTAKNGEVAKHTLVNGPIPFSGRGINDESSEKEYIPTKEELELARKAEELRKEEDAAKLREQRRLEEKSKALEALERKKRNAEKAQLRAELRSQKEAEQREKEREKRLRKKERKKASGSEIADGNNTGESIPSSEMLTETIKEEEIKDTLASAPKRPQKPSLVTKQTKTKPIPPPLRNRSKRKMQQWMWVIITCMFVVFLFVLGNVGFFSNLSNLRPRNNGL